MKYRSLEQQERINSFKKAFKMAALAGSLAAGSFILPISATVQHQTGHQQHQKHYPRRHAKSPLRAKPSVQPVPIGISALNEGGSYCARVPNFCLQDQSALFSSGVTGYANIKQMGISEDLTQSGKPIKNQREASLQLNTNMLIQEAGGANSYAFLWLQNIMIFNKHNSTVHFQSSINNATSHNFSMSGKGGWNEGYFQYDTQPIAYSGKNQVYLSISVGNSPNYSTVQFDYNLIHNGISRSKAYETVRIRLPPTNVQVMAPSLVTTTPVPSIQFPQLSTDLVFAGPYSAETAVFSKMNAYLGLYSTEGGLTYTPLNIISDESSATGETAKNIMSKVSKNSYVHVVTGQPGKSILSYDNTPLPQLLRKG